MANDPWFRGLELKYGPDGGVYVTDWSDTGECHETDADNAHRENGRIYKVTYGRAPSRVKVDLAASSDEELARLQLHKNDWYVRTARRLLQERAAAGRDLKQAHAVLRGDPRQPGRHNPPPARPLGSERQRRPGRSELWSPAGRPRRRDPRLGRPSACRS